MVCTQFVALLRTVGGTCHVIEYRIGVTDMAWQGWAEKHKAPREISAMD
jgi:hypothetical protein